jgi:hypothetical protein
VFLGYALIFFLYALSLAYLPLFYSPFYTSKVMLVSLFGLGFFSWLLIKKGMPIPEKPPLYLFFSGCLGLLMSLFYFQNFQAGVTVLLLFSYVFVFFLISTQANKDLALFGVFASGLVQAVIGVWQWLMVCVQTSAYTKSIGSIGNPEFLSLYLGISLCCGWALLDNIRHGRMDLSRLKIRPVFVSRMIYIGSVLMCFGILSSGNKGTLLFFFIFLMSRLKKVTLWHMVGSAALLFSLFSYVYWETLAMSLKTRVLLFLVDGWLIGQYPWTGVGISRFGEGYHEALYAIFTKFPEIRESLGTFSSFPEDGHNLILHAGVEYGIFGIIWALLFLIYSLRIAKNTTVYLRVCIVFLLVKSLFTVVLTSLTGAVLCAIILGVASNEKIHFKPIAKRVTFFVLGLTSLFTVYFLYLQSADYYYLMARKSLASHALKSAESALKKVVFMNPTHPNGYLDLTYIHYLKKNNQAMENMLALAYKYSKNAHTVRLDADIRFYTKDYKKSRERYTYLETVFPDHLRPKTHLALMDLMEGNYADASQRSLEIIQSSPRIKHSDHAFYTDIAKKIMRDINVLNEGSHR